MIHVGIGYDVHQLVEGRKLILGGVDIPHTKGLDGHSDADALMHAITTPCSVRLVRATSANSFPTPIRAGKVRPAASSLKKPRGKSPSAKAAL